MLAESVSPAGMAVGMLALIVQALWLVVTAQLFVAEVTEVGGLPGVALLITNDGTPVMATVLIALTCRLIV